MEYSEAMERMLRAHLSNKGLQYVVQEAANALGNPIVVVDPSYRYIAYHMGNLEGDSSPFARSISEELRNETLLDETIAYIHEHEIDAKIARTNGPLIMHNTRLEANTMTLAVKINGVCIGHVMMIDHLQEFTQEDTVCFELFGKIVCQELQKNDIWHPTAGELGGFFLANLLNDRSPSEAVTAQRIKTLNFHPKPVLWILCFHTAGEGFDQRMIEHLAAQIRPILHSAIYTRFHQQLVVLLSRDSENDFDDTTMRLLYEVAALNGLSVGISNSFSHLTSTRTAYDQARHAVRYGEQMHAVYNDHAVFRYSDYAYVHGLDIINRRLNLLDMVPPALVRLAGYDSTHDSELMETLFCYLQVAGSAPRAAALLNLHKNTMLYRLNRIKEILGCDLTSGEEQLLLQFGFRVLLYLRLFQPRLCVERSELRKEG